MIWLYLNKGYDVTISVDDATNKINHVTQLYWRYGHVAKF